MFLTYPAPIPTHPQSSLVTLLMKLFLIVIWEHNSRTSAGIKGTCVSNPPSGYVRNMDISHNEVCHLNYSGICVGWGWTSLESGMCNNRIEANYVHHFARRLYDAGGLYTLSNQPGSVMRNNRIEHLIEAPYATNDRAFYIYLDEATDGYTMENNWCPTERFDSNRPGKKNVWKNNGPQVADSIKYKAGRIKQD